MALVLNGSGTIAGLSAGGLPDGVITADDLAAGVGGKVLQVVSVVNGSYTDTTSTSYVDTSISASITPSSTSSKILILIDAQVTAYGGGSTNTMFGQIVKNGTSVFDAGYLHRADSEGIAHNGHASISYLDSPSSTSALTYKLQIKTDIASTNVRVNSGGSQSTITLMEIAA